MYASVCVCRCNIEYAFESSICVQNNLERLDPQFTNYQFKLNVKQLMWEI